MEREQYCLINLTLLLDMTNGSILTNLLTHNFN